MGKDEVKKKAFIIMPITVPEHCLPLYEHSGGENHFRHVLEALFIPAVEAIGYEPVPPSFKGSVNIHAEIVKALSAADLVLCDMSALNPNAFWELGARSALDRPAALVVDEHHKKTVPFDLNTIGYCEYKSTLHAWDKEKQVEKLAQHLKDTIAHGDQNALWKYFGVSATGTFDPSTSTEKDKLDLILREMKRLASKAGGERPSGSTDQCRQSSSKAIQAYCIRLRNMMDEEKRSVFDRDYLARISVGLNMSLEEARVVYGAMDEFVTPNGMVVATDLVRYLQRVFGRGEA